MFVSISRSEQNISTRILKCWTFPRTFHIRNFCHLTTDLFKHPHNIYYITRDQCTELASTDQTALTIICQTNWNLSPVVTDPCLLCWWNIMMVRCAYICEYKLANSRIQSPPGAFLYIKRRCWRVGGAIDAMSAFTFCSSDQFNPHITSKNKTKNSKFTFVRNPRWALFILFLRCPCWVRNKIISSDLTEWKNWDCG